MRVARTVGAQRIAFAEEPEPSVHSGEVRIAVHAVSLCGTDLHIFADDFPTALPLIQGHELSGVVMDAPPGSSLSPGDRVAVDPLVSCGACRACRTGRSNVCARLSVLGCYQDGGFVEVLSVPASRVHRAPEDLPLDIAALGEPTSISLQAVSRAEPVADEVALVLGCGPIGLLAALALSERGVTVIAADIDPNRVALAERFGATVALTVGTGFPDAAQSARIADLTDGNGPDIIIEATGVPAALENAVRLIGSAGRIVQVGISSRAAQITIKHLTDKEIDLRGSRNSLGLIPDALALLARHPDAVAALVTHRFAFEELDAAFRTMADPGIATGKIIVLMPVATSSGVPA